MSKKGGFPLNYVFISPAYPVTCTQFCDRLNRHGVNVLGIGDVPYDTLNDQLKQALTEYYFVDSLEDYDQVYRAVAFFIHKYGRIDWLESLNEYWLPVDARLRTDFNIAVGTREDRIGSLVRKSLMKRLFVEAKIPTARQHIVSDLKAAKAFVKKVGYPVIVKPDIGVGANGTMKINGEDELLAFYSDLPQVPYVMEEFLCGDICTYDAILDADCEPLFESMCTYPPVIDSVQNDESIHFYTVPDVPAQLRDFGRKAAKAFGADRRFVHFEFINITKDYEGIGKAGGYAIMEVNMRPALFLFLRFPDVSYKPDDFEKRSKRNVSNYDCRGSGQIHRRSRRDRSEFLCRYGKSRKTARCDHAAVP